MRKRICPHCGHEIKPALYEDEVLAHLADKHLPLPASSSDLRAYPRTANGIAEMKGWPIASVYRALNALEDQMAISRYKVKLVTRSHHPTKLGRAPGFKTSFVWQVTEVGRRQLE
jgi:hypothetical protein